MKKLLMTGGSGFIGSALCSYLGDKDYEIHVLTRQQGLKQPGVTKFWNTLAEIPRDQSFEYVVNLAGEPLVGRWNEELKKRFYESRVLLTDHLVEWFEARQIQPKAVVSGSAVGYYGPQGNHVLAEDGPVTNCFSHLLCDAWETSAARFRNLDSRVCCVRTGIVLGKGGGALERMLPAFKMGLGGRLGSGEQYFSWIHLKDMIRVIEFCLEEQSLYGPVNAVAPRPVNNRELTETLARKLSRPAFFHMPAFMVRLIFGEMADELLLTGQYVVPEKLKKRGFTFEYPELDLALDEILGEEG